MYVVFFLKLLLIKYYICLKAEIMIKVNNSNFNIDVFPIFQIIYSEKQSLENVCDPPAEKHCFRFFRSTNMA